MTGRPNIVLVGFMGTGKTSVGRLLADRLGMRFMDLDDCIVRKAGRSIPAIFETQGEAAFRALERQAVEALSGRQGLVVATGGGVVLNPDNIRDLERSGMLFCLTASPGVILERLREDRGRPLLNASDAEKGRRIRTLLDARRPLYEAIPRRINTDRLDAQAVAQQILDAYANGCD